MGRSSRIVFNIANKLPEKWWTLPVGAVQWRNTAGGGAGHGHMGNRLELIAEGRYRLTVLSGELRLEVLSVGNASVSGPMELRPNKTVEIPGP